MHVALWGRQYAGSHQRISQIAWHGSWLAKPAITLAATICLAPRVASWSPPRSLDGPVVVREGRDDAVGDGRQVVVCEEEGSPRRAGGQVRSAVGCGVDCKAACWHVM